MDGDLPENEYGSNQRAKEKTRDGYSLSYEHVPRSLRRVSSVLRFPSLPPASCSKQEPQRQQGTKHNQLAVTCADALAAMTSATTTEDIRNNTILSGVSLDGLEKRGKRSMKLDPSKGNRAAGRAKGAREKN